MCYDYIVNKYHNIKKALRTRFLSAFYFVKAGEIMKHTFRTLWKGDSIVCVCTLANKKCEHVATCEELEFKMVNSWNTKECMRNNSYKRKNGAIRQVRQK
jgi:hypothetical protein